MVALSAIGRTVHAPTVLVEVVGCPRRRVLLSLCDGGQSCASIQAPSFRSRHGSSASPRRWTFAALTAPYKHKGRRSSLFRLSKAVSSVVSSCHSRGARAGRANSPSRISSRRCLNAACASATSSAKARATRANPFRSSRVRLLVRTKAVSGHTSSSPLWPACPPGRHATPAGGCYPGR